MKLPIISFCGINFNNNKWAGHIRKCIICQEEYNRLTIEKNNIINNWDKKCKCGCGRITKYPNIYILGHSVKNKKQSEEHIKRKLESWVNNGNSEKLIRRLKNNNPCHSEKNIKRMINDNPAKKESARKKISDNNSMKKSEYRDKIKQTKKIKYGDENYNNSEKNKQTCLERYGYDNPAKIKNFLEKRINTYTKRLSNGDFVIKNNWKCGNYIRHNGEIEWHDSSLELSKMKEYDDKNIKWTKKHKIRIPYIKDNGINSFYLPDFFIEEDDVKSIVEVKGYTKTNDILKATAGINWCQKNNMNYYYLLGEKMEIDYNLSYIIK